jgi:hypothetical protein
VRICRCALREQPDREIRNDDGAERRVGAIDDCGEQVTQRLGMRRGADQRQHFVGQPFGLLHARGHRIGIRARYASQRGELAAHALHDRLQRFLELVERGRRHAFGGRLAGETDQAERAVALIAQPQHVARDCAVQHPLAAA